MKCKLTYWDLSRMAQSAIWAEAMYLELGLINEACRYHAIWYRICKAMINDMKGDFAV